MPALTLDQPWMWLITIAAALLAGFIRGFTGFGGPAIMTLILVQLYQPITVLPKVILIDAVSNLKLLPNTWREVDWPVTGVVVVSSLLGAPLGLYLLDTLDPLVAKRSIALVAAGSTAIVLLGWRLSRRPSLWAYAAVGLLTGIAMGATYIALMLVAFLLATPARPQTTRAITVYWACALGVALCIGHFLTGSLSLSDIWRSALVGIVYLLAAVLGSACFRRASERSFRQAVLWLLMILSGLALVG
ncbi:MAG: sulfite exporter TauE/SafE family protein [Gammaproteobacteria bacterium]|nr:sulfite exporter TauE/SafE family protein [Gammaproteobacteria bacterium]